MKFASLLYYVTLLLWSGGLIAGSIALGSLVLRRLAFSIPIRCARWVLAAGVGAALLSYLFFAFSSLNLLSPLLLWVISGIWLLAGVLFWQKWQRQDQGGAKLNSGIGKRLAWAALVSLLVLNAISALSPETGWDALAYHLALPKMYLQSGGFYFRPDIFHNLFPQLVEMLYLPALIFPFGVGAKVVHYFFGILAAAALIALGQQEGKPAAGWLAAVIFCAQYLVHIESGTAFIDLALAAYAALALLAALRALREENQAFRWLVLSVFLVGMLAAVKWHGLILVALAWFLASSRVWRTPGASHQKRLLRIGWLAGWGLLPSLPYMGRAWWLGRNPIWPLGYRLFGGVDWDLATAERMTSMTREFAGKDHGWLGLVRLPYDLFVHGGDFGVGGAELRWPLVGLLLVGLIWFFLLRHGRQKPGPGSKPHWALPAAAVAAFLVIWFLSSPQVRFLMPLFPLAAWLAAVGITRVWALGTRNERLLAVALATLFFLFHPPLHRDTPLQVKTLLGLASAEAYCAQKLKHYPACQWLNQQVAPKEKVLLFGENRGFHLDVDYVWGDAVQQKVVDYRALKTPENLAERLEELGVRWVLFRTDLYPETYLDPGLVMQMQECLAQRAELQREFSEVSVYRLIPGQ